MAKTKPFRKAPAVECRVVSQAEVIDVRALLTNALATCPACTGRGVFHHKHPVTGFFTFSPCPCGGTDEDRIDLNDFGGAA